MKYRLVRVEIPPTCVHVHRAGISRLSPRSYRLTFTPAGARRRQAAGSAEAQRKAGEGRPGEGVLANSASARHGEPDARLS